jgi:hypothetical protein
MASRADSRQIDQKLNGIGVQSQKIEIFVNFFLHPLWQICEHWLEISATSLPKTGRFDFRQARLP